LLCQVALGRCPATRSSTSHTLAPPSSGPRNQVPTCPNVPH
jgi:hypothetical protein